MKHKNKVQQALLGTNVSLIQSLPLKDIKIVSILLKPLPEGATIWLICATCGHPFALKDAEGLIERGKMPSANLLKEYCIVSPTCPSCEVKTEGRKAELKKIADLINATQNG